ncbi:MAG: homoserine dehydrogenase [Phenylobacterium sp.]|uniref:homoserine dehydrogenase n=1 Tax=Phenylobacterium sp. TaxID=1871053 RepID=UPI0025F37BAC|nr:homoserine dehydrogenase [Phenylobacterium sp.]MCA3708350.1 homoserine dehydrogenase [Phenylobacterium sp.]
MSTTGNHRTWRIGVAGLGTVGSGLLGFLSERPDYALEGGRVVVTGVSARSRSRSRPVDISRLPWFDDPVALAQSPDIDIFVELVGGSDGPAKAAVEAALEAGKAVVTANKALIAEHGAELAALAESRGVPLLFEAAVMGGVPAVKTVREALVGEDIRSLSGILNGTCNYILTEMETSGSAFADVLAEAQRLGYAEADPTMDVGGFDAAHKITILAALAFGGSPNFAAAEIHGITGVDLLDIRLAGDLGYRVKLIASAERAGTGARVRVRPFLVRKTHPIAQADGALNALFIEGSRIGRIFLQGPGAGAGPTAAAVAADIADVMAGARRPVFQAPAETLSPCAPSEDVAAKGRGYIRVMVRDEPGVLAAVSEELAEAGVSIESFLQKPPGEAAGVPIVMTTHTVAESVLDAAVARIARLPAVLEPPRLLHIAGI